MSSTINDVTGRDYKVLVDNTTDAFVWNRLSFWTHASDVEFDDGGTAQDKLGDINGITTSTSVTTTGYAADASTVTALYKLVTQYVSATLSASATTLTFTNSNFSDDTHFEVWTDTYGVSPTAMSLSSTTLTLTFDAQDDDVEVEVHYFDL